MDLFCRNSDLVRLRGSVVTRSGPPTAVVGTAYSEVATHSREGIGALAVAACQQAVADAGLTMGDIDGVVSFHRPQESMPGQIEGVDYAGSQLMVSLFGLTELGWFASLDRGLLIGALAEASNAIQAGSCSCALVFRALTSPESEINGRFHDEVSPVGQEFTTCYGLPALGASLPYSEYISRYGARREHMARLMVDVRQKAALNTDAIHYGNPITEEDYLNSEMLFEPLSLLDCELPVTAAGALVVTSAERAQSLRWRPAYVVGRASLGFDFGGHGFPTLDTLMEAAAHVGSELWRDSGLGSADVDIVQVYDSFSYLIYLWLEALGFCGEGEAFEFVQGGRVAIDGALPTNTSGGSLGMGRLHGLAQVIEAVRQVQGRCGDRQVRDVNVALATAGMPTHGAGALLFSKQPLG